MDPLGAITPYRESGLFLDIDLAVVQEPGIKVHRRGHNIARRAAQGVANKSEWVNVKHWSSGCWGLEPIQQNMANIHESTAIGSHVITGWSFIKVFGPSGNQDMMQPHNNFKQSDIAGASYSGSVPTTGDSFYRKSIPATGMTDPADPAVAGANTGFDSARPAIDLPNTDVPMDRTMLSTSTYPADTGFFVRWRPFGTSLEPHRYQRAVHFGQYALVMTGTGEAQLWEYALTSGDSPTNYWVQRHVWRYTQEAHAAASAGCMAIFPHIASDGNRYIAFSNLAKGTAARTNTGHKVDVSHTVAGEEIYRVTTAVTNLDQDQSPGHVTTADYVRVDFRRECREDIQISVLAYDTDAIGTLYDDPILVPNGNFTGNTSTVNQNYGFFLPTGTLCTGDILDAETGVTFVPGTDKYPRAKFTLSTTNATHTPTLWSYHHLQAPAHLTVSPGEFVVYGREYNINGYAGDPQTELATVEAFDPSMTHTRLTKRGRFAAAIKTIFAPDLGSPGDAVTVTLFHGTALSPQSEQVGADLLHAGGAGPGAVTLPTGTYIAPKFRRYSFNIVGAYYRLNQHVQPPYPEAFANDPDDPQDGSGFDQTWKITDIINDVLNRDGYTADYRNIPDLPYRIWPGYTESSNDIMLEPTTGHAEWLVRIVREHLGAYLYFEPNAGPYGQWTLLFGTQPLEDGTFANPVYNFTGDGPSQTAPGSSTPITTVKATGAPGAYAAVDGVPTTFYSHIRYAQNPPNFNKITISAGIATTDSEPQHVVKQVVFNPISYKVPGSSIDPDPDHPDFIGEEVPYELIAPQLVIGAGGGSDIAQTQGVVDWFARRYYDFLCHGQKLTFIDCPLVFIQDTSLSATADSSSGNWRPLRFQDPVMLDGDPSYLVKSVNFYWSSDRAQRMTLELIAPFPGQHFIGHDELEKVKAAHRASIAKHAGMHHGATHSGKTVAAHKHVQHHHMPVAGPISSIQNADGSFISMTGWNTIDGSDG